MARIYWLCPMVLEDPARNRWVPQINLIRSGPAGAFPAVWSVTDVVRGAPYAIGAADVDAAQQTLVEADTMIHVWAEGRGEWTQAQRDRTAQRRVTLNNYCDMIGVARPASEEVGRDTVTRIRQLVDNRTADDLLVELGQF